MANYRSASSASGSESSAVSTLRYSDQRTLQMHIDFYNDQWDTDTCSVPDTSPDSGGSGSGGGSSPLVSGGSSVVINTASGPWHIVQQEGDGLEYFAGNEIPGPLPAGATLSIPGAEFPTVAAYPLYQPTAPVRIAPLLDSIVDQNSEFSWVSDNDPATVMEIYFYDVDANGEFVEWNGLVCQAADDGSFTLPQIALDYIAFSQSGMKIRYVRQMRRFEYIDGIAFYQRTRVGGD